MYHTHSGVNLVGASFWDLHILMDGLDPNAVGVNYDVGHATVEGGLGGWINSFRVTRTAPARRRGEGFPLGQKRQGRLAGAVEAARRRHGATPAVLRDAGGRRGFDGPLQLHFEYPLGGATAASDLTCRAKMLAAMKRDLATLRGYLAQAEL